MIKLAFFAILLAAASSLQIGNDKHAVEITIDQLGGLSEVYSSKTSVGSMAQLLSYSSPVIISPSLHARGCEASKISETQAVLTGRIDRELNTDHPGNDLEKKSYVSLCFSFDSPNLVTASCKTWTYVKAGYQGSTPVCYLKGMDTCTLHHTLCSTPNPNGFGTVMRKITVLNDGASVSQQLTTLDNRALSSVDDWFTFAPMPVDLVSSPSLKRDPFDFSPHWQFKAPVVLLQSGRLFAAIVADLSALNRNKLQMYPPFLDLINDGEVNAALAFGVAKPALTFHSIYSRDRGVLQWLRDSPITLDYFVLLSADWPQQEGGTFASAFLWRTWTWREEGQATYLEFDCGAQGESGSSSNAMCSTMRSFRNVWAEGFGTDDDAWFNSWFQTLRTAYGMYLAGVREKDARLQQQAAGVLNLALHAPQANAQTTNNTKLFGAFPSVFWLGADKSLNWANDEGWAGLSRSQPIAPADATQYYHPFHMAWTGYWLLKWQDLVNDPRIVPYATQLGDFLLRWQGNSGVIPAWIHVNAETAGCALFLAKLYQATGTTKYLDGAVKAMNHIEKDILPEHKWFDYETFVSCSPKPFSFYDPYTSQHPQNTLSKIQAAFAYSILYEITKDTKYLQLGVRVVDWTSLTQQVWTHPLLTPQLLGGFTSQNTDAEWSDARQNYAAIMYYEWYRHTGRLEYLERCVAALRSSFAVSPYENWSHEGGGTGDGPGALSSFHWGTGSGMTSVELLYDALRDGFIDATAQHGVCVNGCSFDKFVFTLDSLQSARTLAVSANGKLVGTFTPAQLRAGVSITIWC